MSIKLTENGNEDHGYLQFGPFVWKTKAKQEFIDELLERGLGSKGRKYNTELASHFDTAYKYEEQHMDWFKEQWKPYVDDYVTLYKKFHRVKNYPSEFQLISLWCNEMGPGDFNPLHSHVGQLSWVIYLDTPYEDLIKENGGFEGSSMGPGTISFYYGEPAFPRWASTGHGVVPKTGDIFMFPAMLRHIVAPYKANKRRVSVSGNLVFVDPVTKHMPGH